MRIGEDWTHRSNFWSIRFLREKLRSGKINRIHTEKERERERERKEESGDRERVFKENERERVRGKRKRERKPSVLFPL